MKNRLCRLIPWLFVLCFITIQQRVYAQPHAAFSATPLTGCSPLVVNFTDLSTGSPTSWNWDLGNGTISSLQNPTASYFNAGTYSIKLVVSNSNGQDSIVRIQYITVFPKPVVAFSSSDTVGCLPTSVQFSDQSVPTSGTITNWLWDFGDGTTSAQQNPLHNFSTAGSFTISLQVTNSDGCIAMLTKPNYIRIANRAVANFTNTLPSPCVVNPSITFTNLSTGQGPLTFQWLFGDGGSSTLTNPVHTYTTPGTYSVQLIATSPFGCSDTIIKQNLIYYGSVQSQFTYPDSACVGSPATFNNTSTPVPSITTWNFGDGTTGTGLQTVKTYSTAGTFTVKMVNNYGNCKDSISHSITINPKPNASFTGDITSSCQAPLTVNFNAANSGLSYAWNFGDGNNSVLEDPAHTYSAAGTYTVQLVVTSNLGCSDTITRTNYISITPPQITITGLPRTGCVPLTITPVSSVSTNEPVISYLWDFGDGTTSNAPLPSHTYNSAGTYSVTLTIVTTSGCTNTVTITDAVKTGTKPVANFTAVPPDVCAKDPVVFTNTSTPVTDQWLWDFGDGNTSTLENPNHIYNDTGYFNVTLVVWNHTCADTLRLDRIVHVRPPIAIFSVTDSCAKKFIKRFTDNSIGALTWAWDFGDGQTSSVQHPIHTYVAAGTYTVSLTVTNGPCDFTTTHTVNVVDERADFIIDHNVICRNSTVNFTAPAINQNNITGWEWNFGDGSPVSLQPSTTSHLYTRSGNFQAVLVITDIHGCRDSSFKNITVFGPTVNFASISPSICLGNGAVTFRDSSVTDGQHAIVQWEWQYGDGQSGTLTAPPFQHIYNTRGTYDVSLKITDQYGCTDSITRASAIIVSKPIADFNSPDTITCTGKPVQFNNLSQGTGLGYAWNFGDGLTATSFQPVHNYSSTGIYTVRLNVTDQYGCKDTLIRPDYINISLPLAGFQVSDSFSTCPPLQVAFTSLAQNNLTISWDFGDGNTSLLTDPVHNYTIAGIYFAKQYVTGPGGCRDSVTRRIEIRGPSGTFSYTPINGCEPLTVNFTANARNHTSILWDFTDGSTVNTTGSTISHVYTAMGDYLPRMILIDSGGCTVPVSGIDSIHVSGVDVNFSSNISTSCDAGLVTFTNHSTTNDSIISWLWSFGDGTTSAVQDPQHLYTAPGTYPVKLRAVNSKGCVDSLVLADTIHIYERPLISINGPASACIPASVQFSAVINGGDSTLLAWRWNMGNGQTDTTRVPASPLYNNAGTYTIRAIATNEHNCSDTTIKTFIAHPLPVIDAGADKPLCLGTPVQLQASGGVSYVWETSTSLSCMACSNPLANPADNTNYVVNGFNQFGCKKSDTVSVRVRKPFMMSHSINDTICIGEKTQLNASGADKYIWSPSASLNSNIISNPVATPTATTVYRVIGMDSDNCFKDTADIPVRVYPIPQVDAGADLTISAGTPTRLSPIVSSDVSKYSWTPAFNLSCRFCRDPLVTTGRNMEFTLEVKNDGGCTSKDVISVFVTCNNGNLFIPNTFSPNGNGVNESFYPRGRGIVKIKSFRVFNRWGEVVFERIEFPPNDASLGWDGTFKGRKLGADVFVYTCDVVCENNIVLSYKGDVTLLR